MAKDRLTFKQLQEKAAKEMDQKVMTRCRIASHLAKLVTGVARRRLYDVKHRGLRHLIDKSRASVHSDGHEDPELVVIRVRGNGGLHSRKDWLDGNFGIRGDRGSEGEV